MEQKDLIGRICLVTGATSGMGKVTALELAKRGATVVLVARDIEKGKRVREEIVKLSGNNTIDVLIADLTSQQDVYQLATEFQEKYSALHVLVNNAGGIFSHRAESVDGIEYTFALNHLSIFLLTNLLLDLMKRSAPARIVTISSFVEKSGKINFEDLEFKQRYVGFQAYGQSKLANVLFTYELARRLEGTGVTANVTGPKFVKTAFGKNTRGWYRGLTLVFNLIGESVEKGADTAIYLATAPELAEVNGKYFARREEQQTSPQSYDQETQKRLWDTSAQATKLIEFTSKS